MSYAIIRNTKYKRENLKGIFRHNERRNRNYSNNNIDKEKSYLNYSLKEPQYSYEKEFDRIRDLGYEVIFNSEGNKSSLDKMTDEELESIDVLVTYNSFEKLDISFSQSDILSKAVICLTRCIAAFSVDTFIKLEYVTGNSFEMKKYVPLQAVPSRKNVIIKILTDNRCLMYFVNSVSHSSDCFYIVSI